MKFSEPKGILQYARIKRLYRSAFPKSERKPFFLMRKMMKKGKTDMWYFSDAEGFLGFAATINGEDTVLIDYFTVAEKRRGKGYGTRMLKALLEHYSSRGVFLEIEIPYEYADNFEQRKKRRQFYLNIGLVPMGTQAKLFGVDMELLGVNCVLSYEQYRNFYRENYSEFAYDHIQEADGKL